MIFAPPSVKYSHSLGFIVLNRDVLMVGVSSIMLSHKINGRIFSNFRISPKQIFNKPIYYSTKSRKNDKVLEETSELQNSNKSMNLSETWSKKQMPKSLAMQGARFETVSIEKQPNPIPAIELISKVPVVEVHENIASCDGGGGRLGHPKIYINLVRRYGHNLAQTNLQFYFRIKKSQFLALIADCVINKNNEIKYNSDFIVYNFNTILSNNSTKIALVSVFSTETEMLALKIKHAKLSFTSVTEE